MIPEHIIAFLQQFPMMHAASRDEQLQPFNIRAFGTVIHSDQTTITFFIPQKHSERMIANLESNGRVALTVVSWILESYQLKGVFVSWRDSSEKDHKTQDHYLERAKAGAVEGGYPQMITDMNFWNSKPSVAITFQVETVFGQTPGPGTGNKVSE